MRVLHITRQGSEVRLDGENLTVWADGERIGVARIPLLESVVLHGGVHLSSPAATRLLAEGIDCVYLTQRGRFKGRFETLSSPAAARRVRQAFVAASAAGRLRAARSIALNKAAAQSRVMRALRVEPERDWCWVSRSLEGATTVAEVQGLEGYGTRVYFGALRKALPAGLSSWKRQRRPAPDGLNALLGYAYAVLQSRVHAAVATVGMDPFIGFLHLPGRPRPSFVLDMMEEFRPLAVEFTAWRLLRELGDGNWWSMEGSEARLSEGARNAVISAIESRLGAFTTHAGTNSRVTLERAIELQVRDFAADLEGVPRRYRPLKAGS